MFSLTQRKRRARWSRDTHTQCLRPLSLPGPPLGWPPPLGWGTCSTRPSGRTAALGPKVPSSAKVTRFVQAFKKNDTEIISENLLTFIYWVYGCAKERERQRTTCDHKKWTWIIDRNVAISQRSTRNTDVACCIGSLPYCKLAAAHQLQQRKTRPSSSDGLKPGAKQEDTNANHRSGKTIIFCERHPEVSRLSSIYKIYFFVQKQKFHSHCALLSYTFVFQKGKLNHIHETLGNHSSYENSVLNTLTGLMETKQSCASRTKDDPFSKPLCSWGGEITTSLGAKIQNG